MTFSTGFSFDIERSDLHGPDVNLYGFKHCFRSYRCTCPQLPYYECDPTEDIITLADRVEQVSQPNFKFY